MLAREAGAARSKLAAMGPLLALVLGFIAAVWVYGQVGGFLGVLLGGVAFVASGWAVLLGLPYLLGAGPASDRAKTRAVEEDPLFEVAEGETYFGGVNLVRFRESGAKRTMGFLGVSDRAYYLGDLSFGSVTNVERIDMRGTGLIPRPSAVQSGSWDVTLTKVSDFEAYERASLAADAKGMRDASRVVATFVLQADERMKLDRLWKESQRREIPPDREQRPPVSQVTSTPEPSESRVRPTSMSRPADLPVRLRALIPRGPDAEFGMHAMTPDGMRWGVAWFVFRHLFWARADRNETIELSGTYIDLIETSPSPDGMTYRLSWTDRGDDSFRVGAGTILPSQRPWIIGVKPDNVFQHHFGSYTSFRSRPSGRSYMAGARELRARADISVSEWVTCPLCGTSLDDRRTEHTARCGGCERFFSDPYEMPAVKPVGPKEWVLNGDIPYRPGTGPDAYPISDRPGVFLLTGISAPATTSDLPLMWSAADHIPRPGWNPDLDVEALLRRDNDKPGGSVV